MICRMSATAVVAALFAVSPAYGTATWLSDAVAETSFTSLSGGATHLFEIETAGGSIAVAPFGSTTGDFDGGNVTGWGRMSAFTDGSATYPPASGLSYGYEVHDRIRVDNIGGGSASILEFELSWDIGSLVTTTAAGDSASSGYNIHITGIGDPADAAGETAEFSLDGIDYFPVVRLFDAVGFPPAGGPEFQLDLAQMVTGLGGSDSSSETGTVFVRYTTPADETTAFSIFVRSNGSAFATGPTGAGSPAVPEPAGLGLAVLGAAALLVRRSR